MAESEKARVSGESPRRSESIAMLPIANSGAEKPVTAPPPTSSLHPAVYVITWIGFSGGVILYNKWLLHTLKFDFPIILTTWHMAFATFMTQLLARTTTLLDGRKNVKMTGRTFVRAILPIGFFFSLSLICGNQAYLYLSVAFIQMLKATTPVAVLFASWALRVAEPSMKTFGNVSIIVVGVVVASYGEIMFDTTGVLYQIFGLTFEATRLVMVQKLLSAPEYKMDPLVSLYYYAPVCAVINLVVSLIFEAPRFTMQHVYNVGFPILISNAMVAFLLNVSVVFLIGKTSSLVLTLCGVLKDILLVFASMMIWGTQVTYTQFFGYSIALGGLIYYKLGAEHFKQYLGQASLAWADFGVQRPGARKLVIIGLFVTIVFVLLGGLAPIFAPSQTEALRGYVGGGRVGT